MANPYSPEAAVMAEEKVTVSRNVPFPKPLHLPAVRFFLRLLLRPFLHTSLLIYYLIILLLCRCVIFSYALIYFVWSHYTCYFLRHLIPVPTSFQWHRAAFLKRNFEVGLIWWKNQLRISYSAEPSKQTADILEDSTASGFCHLYFSAIWQQILLYISDKYIRIWQY